MTIIDIIEKYTEKADFIFYSDVADYDFIKDLYSRILFDLSRVLVKLYKIKVFIEVWEEEINKITDNDTDDPEFAKEVIREIIADLKESDEYKIKVLKNENLRK